MIKLCNISHISCKWQIIVSGAENALKHPLVHAKYSVYCSQNKCLLSSVAWVYRSRPTCFNVPLHRVINRCVLCSLMMQTRQQRRQMPRLLIKRSPCCRPSWPSWPFRSDMQVI